MGMDAPNIAQMSAEERMALMASEAAPVFDTDLELAIDDNMTGAPWGDKYPKDPEQWENQLWRLHNLYFIVAKDGNKCLFQPNWAQVGLIENLWYLNVILKARQFGFTTFIDILLLDNAIWQPDQRNGIIAHNREDAVVIFRDKVKYPYDHLPQGIKDKMAPKLDSANEMLFSNNSSIRVGTSMRSGTFQMLHISEYGKLCAKTPEKAREVKTGALNTVQKGQIVFIESTAEGRSGHFFELCERAQNMEKMGKQLSALDYKFHFFPWWISPDYQLDDAEIHADMVIPKDLLEYFYELEAEIGKRLSMGQKIWYWKKWQDQGDDMKREYPSTPKEAFEASIEGAYFKHQMARVRLEKRIRPIPYIDAFPVDTFWDFGYNDRNCIWFMQHVGLEYRFIDYYDNSGEELAHYVKILQERPYIYGTHYVPWDAGHKDLKRRESLEDRFHDLHVRNTLTIDRIDTEAQGYNATRAILGQCWFDESNCAKGIEGLDHYRKEWDEKLGEFKDMPKHDWASHPSKAFETFATGYRRRPSSGKTGTGRRTRPSGMAV